MIVGISFVLLLLGIVFLLWGTDQFVDGVADLAHVLRISALLMSIVLFGLEPEEMLTAVIAAFRGMPALAAGNILGTNITITTLALGIGLVQVPLEYNRRLWQQALLAGGIIICPIIFLWSGNVNGWMGLCLLALFVGYLWFLFRMEPRLVLQTPKEEDDDDDEGSVRWLNWLPRNWRPAARTFIGLSAMIIAGPLVVDNAFRVAQLLGQGQGVIGATILALGSGAEMIALSVSAARKKRLDVLIGGIIGSFVYNLLVTLGLAAVIRPVPLEPRLLQIALPLMSLAFLSLLLLTRVKYVMRSVGCVLIGAYLVYLMVIVFGL